MNNIFKLSKPDDWICKVIDLAPGHGFLTVELTNSEETSKLRFSYVDYFSGWTAWKGADFRIGTENEYINTIHQVAPRYKLISQSDLLEMHPFDTSKLYICRTVNGDQIYIIAGAGMIVDSEENILLHI